MVFSSLHRARACSCSWHRKNRTEINLFNNSSRSISRRSCRKLSSGARRTGRSTTVRCQAVHRGVVACAYDTGGACSFSCRLEIQQPQENQQQRRDVDSSGGDIQTSASTFASLSQARMENSFPMIAAATSITTSTAAASPITAAASTSSAPYGALWEIGFGSKGPPCYRYNPVPEAGYQRLESLSCSCQVRESSIVMVWKCNTVVVNLFFDT